MGNSGHFPHNELVTGVEGSDVDAAQWADLRTGKPGTKSGTLRK